MWLRLSLPMWGTLVQSLVQESKRTNKNLFLKSKELFHLQEMLFAHICSLKSSEKRRKLLIRKVHEQRADHLR